MASRAWWPLLLALAMQTPAQAACIASAGPARTSLMELYTSEGCSSCPPADRWLSALKEAGGGERLAFLAFHVDYWNKLGWPDRFSNPAYSARQRWLARKAGGWGVYTPQFVVDGRDWRPGWSGSPPDAKSGSAPLLRIEMTDGGASRQDSRLDLRLEVTGQVTLAKPDPDARLYLALYENRLSTAVQAGENSGRQLHHDYVVRQLLGPFPVPADGRLAFKEAFTQDKTWKRPDLGVTAFVDNAATGEVMQAVQRALCVGSK